MLEHFRTQIIAATAAKQALRLRGGGSKAWYGGAVQGEELDTRAFTGVIAYDPTELVITARCGTPLAEIETLLARHGQMLAFEPPRFHCASTIGGVVAAGLSGPRRMAAGAVRDFVLGAKLMSGQGEVLNFGGQVMKNVAGYDVARLLAGSLGTLGLITEVSLKVLPLPVQEATLRMALDEITALRLLNEWGGQPLPLSASCWQGSGPTGKPGGELTVRLSGARAAIAAALPRLARDAGPGARPRQLDAVEAGAFWASLRDQHHPYFGEREACDLWRLAVPPHASAIILKGESLIEWGGGQRWLKTGSHNRAETAQAIRRSAAAAGGHATLFRAAGSQPATDIPVFHPPAPALALLNRRMQQAFDPAGIFNPGRQAL